MKKFCLVIFISVIIIACSSKTFAPTNEQMNAMQQKVPDITLANAKAGYKLYSEKCSACHQLYRPGKYTIAQWNTILPKMFLKAKLSSDSQQKLIQDYLHALAKM